MSIWKAIFKNLFRIKTSRFRKNRIIFIILLYAIVLFWAIYLGPNIFNIILAEVVQTLGEENIYLMVPFIEYFITTIFLITFIYPLYNLYRKTEIGQTEILLASPVKNGDIFFGEFLSKMFFYFPGLLGIGPMIISALDQISSLNTLQIVIIYITLFIQMAFGLLLGTIIANLIEFKMARSKKVRDFGRSIIFLIALLVVAFFYLIRLLFDYLITHPEFKIWLIFYPSYWYTNIIFYVINPSLINSQFLFIFANFSLGILTPPLFCFFSYKKAHHFYSLESSERELSITVKTEKKFYKYMRKITLGKGKGLVITQLKQVLRKNENKFKIIIITSLTFMFGVIFSISFSDLVFFGFNLIQLKLLVIIILSWMGGILFGIMMGINVFIYSKPLLYRFKGSPRGVKPLVFSYLYENLYLIIFVDIIITILFSFLYALNFYFGILFFLLFIINCEIIFLQAVGIQCSLPLFEDRSKNAYLISYIVLFTQFLSLLIVLYIVIPLLPNSIALTSDFIFILTIHTTLTLGVSFTLFLFGLKKLSNYE
ncbi:MAG: hypothetical protein ACFFG0_32420 [Candidatus Thorarchaeota archaeon]